MSDHEKVKPTPGIELMPRAIAERHFEGLFRDLTQRIDALPISEALILAAEMFEAGVSPRLVVSVARRVADRIERDAA